MITIGGHFSGPELKGTAVDRAIGAAMRAAIEARGDFKEGSAPALNVVFCVPGSLGRPDWDHGRVAKYSPKAKLVLVQVAVPQDMVASNAALDYVVGELHGANALAFEFYRQKNMHYPLREAEELVAKIRQMAAATLQVD